MLRRLHMGSCSVCNRGSHCHYAVLAVTCLLLKQATLSECIGLLSPLLQHPWDGWKGRALHHFITRAKIVSGEP